VNSHGLPLADELFLLGLEDPAASAQPRRPRLAADALGYLMGAALIAELVLAGCITVDHNVVYAVVDDHGAPVAGPPEGDDVLLGVYEHLRSECNGLDKWVPYLQLQDVAGSVAGRLRERGVLVGVERVGLRRRLVYRPADPLWLSWRPVRLSNLLKQSAALSLDDRVLLTLINACGLRQSVFPALTPEASHYLDALLDELRTSSEWRLRAVHQIAEQVKWLTNHSAFIPHV